MKIYLVDDEVLSIDVLEYYLKDILKNPQIEKFTSVYDYLEKLKKEKPDVIFMDIEMPGLKGIDLAKETIKIYKEINIVFVTGYSNFLKDAFDLFASGYLLKPVVKEKLYEQLEHLRYKVNDSKNIVINTFGSFTVFVDGNPISFKRKKSLMALAYLVHKCGAVVSRKDLSSAIFDDGDYSANRQSYLSKIIQEVLSAFNKVGVTDFVLENSNGIYICKDKCDCDLYKLLDGDMVAKKKFNGIYMEQFEFGEEFTSKLLELSKS